MRRSTTTAAESGLDLPAIAVRKWTLANGLTLLVQEDHSAPVASVQAWVETGSIHEGDHLGAGLSHMLEHMLFKGTPTRSPSAFAQTVQDFGGYINAYTSFDRTVYWIDIPSKGVPVALELLADALQNSTLPPEEFVKEQEVIRREFAMGYDDPDRVAGIALFANAYRTHPYRHPVIGYLDVFNTLIRDDVSAYYKARYVPNNIFFVVAGDVNPDEVQAQVVRWYGNAPRAALPAVFIAPEPPQLGRRETHEEYPAELTRLHFAWHVPEVTHPDIPALDLLAVALGSGRSSRLYKRLREELAVVHSAEAWCYAPSHAGLFGIDGVLDPEKRAEVVAEALKVITELREEGVSQAELDKAKRMTLAHQLHQLTTMRGKASDIGSNWLITRNVTFSRDYLRAVGAVTRDDIARVLRTYFDDRNLTITSLNPPGASADALPAAAAISAKEIEEFTLANGLRLLVREDCRLPVVSIAVAFKAGLLAENGENNGITRLLAKVLLKGTQARTGEQIADEIEAAGGSISSDGGNNSLTVTLRVMRPELPLALNVLGDVLCNATMPEKAVHREKEVQLAAIKADEEEMTSVARNLLREQLLAGHPYALRHLGTPESVARLTQDDLLRFRDQHIVARNGVISVFGDVRADEVKALLEKELIALSAGTVMLAHPPQPVPVPAALELEALRNKAQAVLMIGYLGADLFSPDRAALDVIDEASSDLGSRFFVRIREEMGLAYFVGSSHVVGLARGPFVFYLGTDPIKIAAVKAALLDEIRQLAENGLSNEEVARAREKLLGQQEIRLQSNDIFAMTTALDELYGLGARHYRQLRQRVEAVTFEEVRAVARRYFAEQLPVIAVVRPA